MDALTNNDWPPVRVAYRSNYLLAPPIFSGESLTESVSLDEVKRQVVITASDDDVYLTDLIKQCRSQFEKMTGIGLISRTVTVYFSNGRGNIELPYGPVTSFTSLSDKGGFAITGSNYRLYGSPFSYLESPVSNYLGAVYVAGYTNMTIPQGLKLDLLKYIAYCYKNRGDELADFDKALAQYTSKHRRESWLL